MAALQFIFWTSTKALALIFLGLLAVKATTSWRSRERRRQGGLPAVAFAVYCLILVLVVLGARALGDDIAAEVYAHTSEKNLRERDLRKAYFNSLRAVQLRPGEITYWQALAKTKIAARQCASLLQDEPAFRTLSHGSLDEDDELHFAYCHFSLSQYDEAIGVAQDLIRRDRQYPAPYLVEGAAYLHLRNYAEAERTFLQLLQFFPTQADGVAGLAQAYFLAGETERALAVLDATAKYPFTPEARQRFEALKGLYAE